MAFSGFGAGLFACINMIFEMEAMCMEKSADVDQNLDRISASLKNRASRSCGDRGLEYSPVSRIVRMLVQGQQLIG